MKAVFAEAVATAAVQVRYLLLLYHNVPDFFSGSLRSFIARQLE